MSFCILTTGTGSRMCQLPHLIATALSLVGPLAVTLTSSAVLNILSLNSELAAPLPALSQSCSFVGVGNPECAETTWIQDKKSGDWGVKSWMTRDDYWKRIWLWVTFPRTERKRRVSADRVGQLVLSHTKPPSRDKASVWVTNFLWVRQSTNSKQHGQGNRTRVRRGWPS